MKTRNYGPYAIALAVAVVGALWLGMPVQTLALLGLVMVCPLMMFFMMRGMHGVHGDGDQHDEHQPDRSENEHDHRSVR